MKKLIKLVALSLILLFLLTSVALAQNSSEFKIPPAPTGPDRYVNDWAKILTSEQRGKLVQLATDIEAKTSAEVVFLTVELDDPDGIKQLAPLIGDTWGVGKKESSNGYVIAVAAKKGDFKSTSNSRVRECFIATGLGSEGVVTDIQATDIFEAKMKPLFLENKWYDGLYAGGETLGQMLSGKIEPDSLSSDSDFWLILIIIVIVVLVLVFLFWHSDLESYGGGSSGSFFGGSGGGGGGSFHGGGMGGGGGGGGC